MPFNGLGVFSRLYRWANDASNGVRITASRMDAEMDGFATALSNTLTRDGQSPALANIPMGNNKLVGLGAPLAATDAATKGYVDSSLGTGLAGAAAVVNVLAYGAVGDGVTDDTAAIQAAIDHASAASIPTVKFPGPNYTFLLAAAQVAYGTFTSPSGPYPFYRGLLKLRSNVSLIGEGCTLKMSGGRFNPGGLFYQSFWDGLLLQNIRISGLVIDGNYAAQTIEAYPSNTGDNLIWQHGHAILMGYAQNVEVDHCTITGWRGNAILFMTDESTGGPASLGYISRGLNFHHNDVSNIFGEAVGGSGRDVDVHHNRFHGDGYWVSAVDPEVGLYTSQLLNWNVYENIFDFRDGLSPPERTPQYASNSTTALAARRHLRRAVSFGFFYAGYPGNVYTENTRDIRFERNIIYQGVVHAFSFTSGKINANHIYNTYEDVTGHTLIGGDAIVVGPGSGGNAVTGLRNWKVLDNVVESDLAGLGIYISDIDGVEVGGNTVRYSRTGGLRLDQCSGIVRPNRFIDVGAPATSAQITANPAVSCGVALYGGQTNPLRVTGQQVIDTRAGAAQGTRLAVFANLAASPLSVIENTIGVRMLEGVVSDINNACLLIGNDDGTGGKFLLNAPITTTGLTVTGNTTIGATTGDTTLTVQGGTNSNLQMLFIQPTGIEYKLGQVPGGVFAMQNFAAGVFQRTDMEIGANGYVRYQMSWQCPFVSAAGDALWFNAGKLYTKPGYNPSSSSTWPASGTDGTVVGTQS